VPQAAPSRRINEPALPRPRPSPGPFRRTSASSWISPAAVASTTPGVQVGSIPSHPHGCHDEPRPYAKCGNGCVDVAQFLTVTTRFQMKMPRPRQMAATVAMAEKSSGLLIQRTKHRPSNGAPDGHDRLMVGQMTTTKCHRRQGDLPVTPALCRPYAVAQAPGPQH
jgi:hypothetical protein